MRLRLWGCPASYHTIYKISLVPKSQEYSGRILLGQSLATAFTTTLSRPEHESLRLRLPHLPHHPLPPAAAGPKYKLRIYQSMSHSLIHTEHSTTRLSPHTASNWRKDWEIWVWDKILHWDIPSLILSNPYLGILKASIEKSKHLA